MFDLVNNFGLMTIDEIKYWLYKLDKSETWLADNIDESKQRVNYLLNKAKRKDSELVKKIENFLLPFMEEASEKPSDHPKIEDKLKKMVFTLPNVENIYPVVTTVRAGIPNGFREEDIIDHVSFDYGKKEGCVSVLVSGDSMMPELKEGDYVLIDKYAHVDQGNIVVAVFNDDTHTIKKFRKREDGDYEFIPINPSYTTSIVDAKSVAGVYKVVRVNRKYY